MANGLFGTGIQTQNIRQTPLAPTGLPGSTYVRPEQREVGGNLRALAESLGNLNTALQGYGQRQEQEKKDPNSEANRAFLDSIPGKSYKELEAIDPEGLNRVQSDALSDLLGNKGAADFRQLLTEEYNTEFDQSGGNFNEWAEKRRQEYAANLPEGPARAAFFRKTEEWNQRFGEEDLKRKIGVAMSERDTAVVDTFRMSVEDGLAKGRDPKALAADILTASGENKIFLAMDGRAQNETIFRLAQEYALKGETGIVEGLLNGKRGDAPSIAQSAEYATKAITLMEQTRTVLDGKRNEASTSSRIAIDAKIADGTLTAKFLEEQPDNEWMTPAYKAQAVQSAAGVRAAAQAKLAKDTAERSTVFQSEQEESQLMGGAYSQMERLGGASALRDQTITGRDGKPKVITAKVQEERTVTRKLADFAQLEQSLTAQGGDPAAVKDQVMKAKLSWFAGNGIMNPEWDRSLNSVSVMASVGRILEKGETSTQLAGYADLYRTIEAANPGYASKLVTDEKSREFFETYSDAVLDGADKEEAMLLGARTVGMTPSQRAAASVTNVEARDLAEVILDDLSDGYDMSPDVIGTVQRKVLAYTGRGMPKEKAVEKVKADMANKVRVINGVPLVDHRDLPQDFEPLVDRILIDTFKRSGAAEGVMSAEDYYLSPVEGESRWVIVRKVDGLPAAGNLSVTPKDLNRYREIVRKEEEDTNEVARATVAEKRKAALDRENGLAASPWAWQRNLASKWRKDREAGAERDAELARKRAAGPQDFKSKVKDRFKGLFGEDDQNR